MTSEDAGRMLGKHVVFIVFENVSKTGISHMPWYETQIRSILAKLRISAHNLQIETGRFSKNKTPREDRFGPYCKTLNIFSVEDEIHFLLSCSRFNADRQKFLQEIYRTFPNTATLNELNMFLWLMSQEDYFTTIRLGNFCKKSFERRTKFLSNPVAFQINL